jgi:hypothetical protein
MSQSQNLRKEFGALEVGGYELNNKVQYSDLTTVSTLTLSDSGKTLYLNSATEFATTLPAVADAAGFHVRFVVKAPPTGSSYTVVSPSADIHGVVASAADATGSAATTAGTPVTTVTFVDAKAVVGDYVDVRCDGTYYYLSGQCSAFDAVTLA